MKKILINALYPEEKRVAIVEKDTLIDFYVEVASKESLKGNIYKGIITRIEPAIQAAFVDIGHKKAGFLQLKEIMPSYFNQPKRDRKIRIQDVLSKGQEVLVQVEKEERDTKGPSLTTYISLAGRYIVMMPGQQERIGISRKIEDKESRAKLKEIFNELKPPKETGFILRTVCTEIERDELANDLKYLTRLWNKIQNDYKKVSPPYLIFKEHDLCVKTVRDYLTVDISEVIVDEETAYKNMKDFLRRTVPWRKINIKLFRDKKPLFSQDLEDQIAKVNDRFVYLPSRGYLVFDKTEALTVIDVNSGKNRKEEDFEATALKTNLEAADEIARQLRIRDIGGLIVIDFIDMQSDRNKKEVERRLKNALSFGKAHIEIGNISKFGILEMTRERIRSGYGEAAYKKCNICDGSGMIKSYDLLALTAIRQIHLRVSKNGLSKINCFLPLESANYLINNKREDILKLEKSFGVKINILSDITLLPHQFKIEENLIEI
ncbi:MAG: Rne/Rng family ribonuclease [Thermodesulfovibrionales bacterium]|nr:Rne/Rng family ribonuclease [Thermodesulfovibrionales bacterium]